MAVLLKIGEELLTRAKEVNVLGTVISDDLKWFVNTKKLISKCGRKFFMLSKLKSCGASQEDLLRIWTTFLRPVCEYAAPVWHSSITNFEKIKLERPEKSITYPFWVKLHHIHRGTKPTADTLFRRPEKIPNRKIRTHLYIYETSAPASRLPSIKQTASWGC